MSAQASVCLSSRKGLDSGLCLFKSEAGRGRQTDGNGSQLAERLPSMQSLGLIPSPAQTRLDSTNLLPSMGPCLGQVKSEQLTSGAVHERAQRGGENGLPGGPVLWEMAGDRIGGRPGLPSPSANPSCTWQMSRH